MPYQNRTAQSLLVCHDLDVPLIVPLDPVALDAGRRPHCTRPFVSVVVMIQHPSYAENDKYYGGDELEYWRRCDALQAAQWEWDGPSVHGEGDILIFRHVREGALFFRH